VSGEYDHPNTIYIISHNHVAQIFEVLVVVRIQTHTTPNVVVSANGHSGIYDSGVTIEDGSESKKNHITTYSLLIVVHMWKRQQVRKDEMLAGDDIPRDRFGSLKQTHVDNINRLFGVAEDNGF
jgi:hypothetical protein